MVSSIASHLDAEVRMRLRSPGTLVALGAILAGTYFWIPQPTGRASSLSWETAQGVLEAPVYSSGTLGLAVTVLGSVFFVLAGFYFVAGSVRRDRERGIGPILASTPLTNSAYIVGKFVSNVAYLVLLSGMMLLVGLFRYLHEGVGAFDASAFFIPFGLTVLPAICFGSAMALLFDVSPGLRGRVGLVAWFFVFALIIGATEASNRAAGSGRGGNVLPRFDPAGMSTLQALISRSIPDAKPNSIASGHVVHDRELRRVAWPGISIDRNFVLARFFSLLWAIPPLLLAITLFDRFDPARFRRRLRLKRREPAAGPEGRPAESRRLASLEPAPARPSAWRSILAESRLVWESAGVFKWALAACAIALAAVPSAAVRGVAAAFLVLLVPVVSETGAREEISGAGALVFSQPGVPESPVIWKTAALGLFLLAMALPFAVRLAIESPERALALLSGLLFVAAFAVGAGAMTGGGKLFSGVYLSLWYVALNGVGAVDFCGVLSSRPLPSIVSIDMLAAGGWILLARVREQRRSSLGF